MFIKLFEEFDLDNLLSHIKQELPASNKDKDAYQYLKDNIDKYISKEEEKKVFLNAFSFLETPIIIDDFNSQLERREWLKELEPYPLLRTRMQKNRLRVNILSGINRIIAMPFLFLDNLDKPIPIISDRANEHINYLRETYQDETLEKKIDFTNQTASLARLFINQMIK